MKDLFLDNPFTGDKISSQRENQFAERPASVGEPSPELSLYRLKNQPAALTLGAGSHYHIFLGLNSSATVISGSLSFEIKPGSTLLLPPGYLPKLREVSDSFDAFCLSFNFALLQYGMIGQVDIPGLLMKREKFIPYDRLTADRFHNIKDLFSKLERELTITDAFQGKMSQLSFIELLLQGFRLSSEHQLPKAAESRSAQLTREFSELVKIHSVLMRSVQVYADRLNVTAKYLSEVVKTETGLSPLHHIHHAIFQQAEHLLSSSALSIKEISGQLGFDTPSHFSRFFKQFSGKSPSNYSLKTFKPFR